ncbi:conserved hypothetical protein [uncultured Desulfobacterium sp.]|uniref:Type VI secretion system FHA domain-containing protein n=1 Tax=uncultured Desulfobacterium sp. TaxID=201089 RepID=A0A445N1X0_9BACT|nr:conserved hypothetical protein [uncultured Desulfobacterium sp.]
MTQHILKTQLAEDIRRIYQSDGPGAAGSIENYLNNKLAGLLPEQRHDVLAALADEFRPADPVQAAAPKLEDDTLSRVFSLLLGREVARDDTSSQEVLKRLGESLNTIFDMLNQIIRVINMSFNTENVGDQTIRSFIGSHMAGISEEKSLKDYLGKIEKAFLITQQAFKQAVNTKVREILGELDPDKISAASGGGLKFGPLRKAECYDIYESKFRTFKQWVESGRFMDDFLREFEKSCQKLYG